MAYQFTHGPQGYGAPAYPMQLYQHGIPVHHPGAAPAHRNLESRDVSLVMRQEPKEALVTISGKEKARKPVDPPPIVELHVQPYADPQQHFLQSPYLFMTCSLVGEKDLNPVQQEDNTQALTGSLVSSLHRLKDTSNTDGGFFVFGDVSVRRTGNYRLLFSLFDYHKDTSVAQHLCSTVTRVFKVVAQKDFRGLDESTYLSRAFSDQGVRLRLRKEPRAFGGQKRPYYTPSTPQEQEHSHVPPAPYDTNYTQTQEQDDETSPPQPKRVRTVEEGVEGHYEERSPHAVRPPADVNGYTPASTYPELPGESSRYSNYTVRGGQSIHTYPVSSGGYPDPPIYSQTSANFYSTPQGGGYQQRNEIDMYHAGGDRDATLAPSYSVQQPYHSTSEHGQEPQHGFTYAPSSTNPYAMVPTSTANDFGAIDLPLARPKSRYEENVDKAMHNLKNEQENGSDLAYHAH